MSALLSIARARRFVISSLGRCAFDPHTGQDARAWEAFVLQVELWLVADRPGRAAAKVAMAATLAAAQRARAVHQTFALAIVAATDGCDLAELWPHLDGIPEAAMFPRSQPSAEAARG